MDVARIEGAPRVGADDLDLRVPLLQVLPRPGHRAAGPHADDEMRELALGLLPDLGAGRAVVGLGVHRVVVLVRQEPPGGLTGEPLGHLVVGLGRLRRDRARADDDLGAVRAEEIALLLALLVGHRADEAVALDRRGHREADAGVAARRLDDGPAGLEETAPLGVLDHEKADPILDGAAGIQVLELRDDRRPQPLADPREAHEGRVTDETEDVRGDGHVARRW